VVILLLIAVLFGVTLMSAWSLMLLVGIAHLDWWPVIPTMSYGTAFTLSAVIVGFASVSHFLAELMKQDR